MLEDPPHSVAEIISYVKSRKQEQVRGLVILRISHLDACGWCGVMQVLLKTQHSPGRCLGRRGHPDFLCCVLVTRCCSGCSILPLPPHTCRACLTPTWCACCWCAS
jgi:hypothetical protein